MRADHYVFSGAPAWCARTRHRIQRRIFRHAGLAGVDRRGHAEDGTAHTRRGEFVRSSSCGNDGVVRGAEGVRTLLDVPRRMVRGTMERLLAPFGARAVERMVEDGVRARLGAAVGLLFRGEAPAAAVEAACRSGGLGVQTAASPEAYRLAVADSAL